MTRGYPPGADVGFIRVKTLSPACPASSIIDGPPTRGPSSICGVLALDHDGDSSGNTETNDWHVFSTRDSAATVLDFCCSNYIRCEIWRAERDRLTAARRSLQGPVDPAPAANLNELLG